MCSAFRINPPIQHATRYIHLLLRISKMTNIQNAYLQLNDWIEKSQGNPITIGKNINCAFY